MKTQNDNIDNILSCMRRSEGKALLVINGALTLLTAYHILIIELPMLPSLFNYMLTAATLLLFMSYTRNFLLIKTASIYSPSFSQSTRFCTKCGNCSHPSSHHCSICQRCVIGMDHHCFFLELHRKEQFAIFCLLFVGCNHHSSYWLYAGAIPLSIYT